MVCRLSTGIGSRPEIVGIFAMPFGWTLRVLRDPQHGRSGPLLRALV
jgi:hypothetical protein